MSEQMPERKARSRSSSSSKPVSPSEQEKIDNWVRYKARNKFAEAVIHQDKSEKRDAEDSESSTSSYEPKTMGSEDDEKCVTVSEPESNNKDSDSALTDELEMDFVDKQWKAKQDDEKDGN